MRQIRPYLSRHQPFNFLNFQLTFYIIFNEKTEILFHRVNSRITNCILYFEQKGVSCSGYLPNSRVIAETLSKDFTYSETFQAEMKTLKIDEKFLKDSIITKGEINFDKSDAQKNLVQVIYLPLQKEILPMKLLLKNVKKMPISSVLKTKITKYAKKEKYTDLSVPQLKNYKKFS